MSMKRASKAEFKAMVDLWESKGHKLSTRIFFERGGMTLAVPCYGNEENFLFLVIDSVLPDPVTTADVVMFAPTTRHGITDSNEQCRHTLANGARCKNWVKHDSLYCAKHGLAENRLAPSSSRLPNQAPKKVTL